MFNTLATAAQDNGHYDSTAATTSNAYSLFLKGMESLGNCNVPDQGRIAVVPREKPHTGPPAREQPRDSPVIER